MKIKSKEVRVTVPIIMSFRDYHEISHLLDQLNELFGGKMKVEELGCDGEYDAIFFLKKDKEYRFLAKEWKNSHKEDQ